MKLMYQRITYHENDDETTYYIMIFKGNHVKKLLKEQQETDGDIPSLGLYDATLRPYSITPGARYRGNISISQTKSGNTRVTQFIKINC